MSKFSIIKKSIQLFTTLTTYALSMVIVYLFILMFINGGTVLVDCIKYGEYVIEYPLMIVLVPLLTYGTYLNAKSI